MASTGGTNLVKYFFYAGNKIPLERKQKLVALAYATARDQQLAPTAILIRSEIHDTTKVNGKSVKDPKGWHGTFAFKDANQVLNEVHTATHGYTTGKEDFTLKEASHSGEKQDASLKGKGKPVWPDEDDLEEYKDSPIAYSHLPEQEP